MKTSVIAFLLIVSQVSAASLPIVYKARGNHIVKAEFIRSPNIDLCPTCVSFAGQFIDQLLNIVLNVGVVGGCGDLCSLLAQKTNSSIAGTVCELLCDVTGIEEFIKVIQNADLDPIYYCELLKVCPIKDDGDAKITSLTVTPRSIQQGDSIKIDMTFMTRNGTGTGEVVVEIDTVDGIPIGDSEISKALAPGQYPVEWTVDAKPDPDCDPTQGPCEQWLPGNYTVKVAVCNGECGSTHPHSQIYDESSATFQVTN